MARDCINPECQKGVTPGVIGVGRGKQGAPLINNGVMTDIPKRWGWVACRACNPDEHAPFTRKNWTDEEMQERARLADAKAPYVASAPNPKLARIALSTPTPHTPAPHPDNIKLIENLGAQIMSLSEKLDKALSQNSDLTATIGRLSVQVGELLTENTRLRTVATAPISPPEPSLGSPPTPKKRKSRQIAKPS